MIKVKKILLIAINSKYIHTNLAVYCLQAFAKKCGIDVDIAEYTINNRPNEILVDIYKQKPDFIAFPCYIWNIEMVNKVACELKKVLENVPIWYGGPEVSYDSKAILKVNKFLKGIIKGEGEVTFYEVIKDFINEENKLSSIEGISYVDGDKIIENEMRPYMNMDDIPFPYEDLSKFENKILYYETSRGCPFSCSYCMSSVDRCVRFRSIDIVKKELQTFLDNKVSLVKFVDRTFNCNRKHTMQIWKYIKEHDNNITSFHFEVSADLLNDEEIEFIKTMRPRLIQLEIGVQSTNKDTIKAINRTMEFDKLATIVKRIKKENNIHQHLDLIAGLPYEGFDSFKNSFNDVYALYPNQLQLGFLKVLSGSHMKETANDYNIVYSSMPPYEVLYTKWLSFDEVIKLKLVEEMVEVYYNSDQFEYTISYIEKFFDTPFDMYMYMGNYYEKNNLNMIGHSRVSRYNILLDIVIELLDLKKDEYDKNEEIRVIKQLLTHDIYLRENIKTRPKFARDLSEFRDDIYRYYVNNTVDGYEEYNTKQITRMTHMEYYDIDIEKTCDKKECMSKECFMLYTYKNSNKNYINNNKTCMIERNQVLDEKK